MIYHGLIHDIGVLFSGRSECRTIVVMGATGAQGGAVIRAIMKDKKFKLRAATRNPDSEKAKKLGRNGKQCLCKRFTIDSLNIFLMNHMHCIMACFGMCKYIL